MTDLSDSASTSTEVLEHECVTMAAQIAQASCRFLLVIAELDRRVAWLQWDGCRSMAHWLSWRCSMSPVTAREHVRVAHALLRLPLVREAMARGELSYSKVRALARIEDPSDEASLVELARTATAVQFDRMMRAARVASSDPEERSSSLGVTTSVTDDGHLRVVITMPIDNQGRVQQAIAAAMPVEDDAAASSATVGMRKAEAAARIFESYLATGDACREASVRNEAVVHVTADESGVVDAATSAGEPVHPTTAERVLCDCRVQGMLGDVSGPIGAGRRTRTIRRTLRRALQRRSGGRCEWAGCDEQVYVEAHHIEAWIAGGATELWNLVLLCWHHHHLVHEGGWSVERTREGIVRARRPDGTVLARPVRAVHVPQLPPPPEDERIVPLWAGEAFDLDACVDAVLAFSGAGSG